MGTGLFFQLATDGRRTDVPLENTYAGPTKSACWLIGGGPSLDELPCAEIAASPLPRLAINLAGTGKLRPTFWTSYDPTARFQRSVYLDPGILKFVHRRRAMDLVPETDFKVCECPATYFFDRDVGRGFSHLLDLQSTKLIDWADSMVQGIDLLYRLGFRRIYFAGCDLRVFPSEEQIARSIEAGVSRDLWHGLSDFLKACQSRGISTDELASLAAPRSYHFDETKSLSAAAQTDTHYYRIVQWLRLSRRCLSLHGLELISVTPGSRLNQFFPYRPVDEVLQSIHAEIGNPSCEETRGLYTQQQPRWVNSREPMRDFKPPNWTESATPAPAPANSRPGDIPEVMVEAEGWQKLGQRFADAYVAPCEAG